MDKLLITFSFLPKTPNLNDRTFWAKKAKQVKDLKAQVTPVLLGHKPSEPFSRVRLRFTFYLPTRRRRDLANLLTCCKPLIDAMVDVGILVDDDYQTVREIAATAEYRKAAPGLEISIEPVED